LVLVVFATIEAHAEGCPTAKDAMDTDRPDTTNSSLVVPTGSLQNENGANFTMRDDGRTIDGTNSRWRLGIAPCLEVLVDLPTYVAPLQGPASRGFTDVAPAVKWQISPLPGKVDLSVVLGVALPTGAVEIAGRGPQPYLQFPWSWELHDGWGVSGMFTEFSRPYDLTTRSITEATFVLEKKLTRQFSLFTEYVGDYPQGESPSQLWNSGALYHINRTQQVARSGSTTTRRTTLSASAIPSGPTAFSVKRRVRLRGSDHTESRLRILSPNLRRPLVCTGDSWEIRRRRKARQSTAAIPMSAHKAIASRVPRRAPTDASA